MATFVLVHAPSRRPGAGARSCLVSNVGAIARSRSIPRGADRTPVERITAEDYVDAIVRVVRTLDERPVLVGHSMGTPIAGVAEAHPDAVAALVFVAGLLPRSGSSLLDVVGELIRRIWRMPSGKTIGDPSGSHPPAYGSFCIPTYLPMWSTESFR